MNTRERHAFYATNFDTVSLGAEGRQMTAFSIGLRSRRCAGGHRPASGNPAGVTDLRGHTEMPSPGQLQDYRVSRPETWSRWRVESWWNSMLPATHCRRSSTA